MIKLAGLLPVSKNIFVVKVLFYFSLFPSCLIPIRIPWESWREILNEPEVASDIDWKHPQPELDKHIWKSESAAFFIKFKTQSTAKTCWSEVKKLRPTPNIVFSIRSALCVWSVIAFCMGRHQRQDLLFHKDGKYFSQRLKIYLH